MKIQGQKIANSIINRLSAGSAPEKFIAVFVAEDDKRSYGFVKKKKEVSKKLGVDFKIYKLSDKSDSTAVRNKVKDVVLEDACGGVVIQLPLPDNLDRKEIAGVLPAGKDIDLLGHEALGAFYSGHSSILPPAVGVVKEILSWKNISLSGTRVAVVGAGFLVGQPVATWFLRRVPELMIFDKGSDLSRLSTADLIISGVGSPGLIDPTNLKEGAGVVDFGYGRNEESDLSGDLNAEELSADGGHLKFYTPTPGGTGPILVAKLFENFYQLNGKI